MALSSIRIFHIETGRHFYGGANQVYFLIRGLAVKGWHSHLLCSPGNPVARLSSAWGQIHEFDFRGDLDVRSLPIIYRQLRIHRPHLLHIHSRRGADVWGLLAAQLAKLPVIITRRVDNPETPWLARLKYNNYDAVVAVSNGVRRVMARYGLALKRIETIPDCVDIDRFTINRDTQWFCETFGFKPYHQVIGMIAQFIPRKGHRHTIEAAPDILLRYPNTRFLFLGKGPLLNDIKTFCRRRFPAGTMVFAGYRPDLHRILPNLTAVVHPAEMEGMGVALLESAASGVPVVASKAGGIPEVVIHDKTGYLIQPESPDSIAYNVGKLLSDPQRAAAMGRNGRNVVKSRFSIDQMVEKYIRIYRKVLRISHQSGSNLGIDLK